MRKVINIPIWYKKNRIVKLRKDFGYNQTEVAQKIGCVLKTYQNYEQGRNFPTLEYATNLSELYNVSIDYLLGKSDYESVDNESIGKIIGLNNTSIETLKLLNTNNGTTQAGHNEIDTLNTLLSDILCTMKFLGGLQDFLNVRYKIPVYHSEKNVLTNNYSDNQQSQSINNVRMPDYIVPSDPLDVVKNSKGDDVYMLTLAQNKNTPYDNYQIPLTTDFFESVALKTIEKSIIELRNSLKTSELKGSD